MLRTNSILSERSIFLFLVTAFFIVFELRYFRALGIRNNPQNLSITYTRDILFFVLSAFLYLPKVWNKASYWIIRLLFILILIGLYSIFFFASGLIVQFLKIHSTSIDVTTDLVIISSWRGFYISLIAVLYSYISYSNKKISTTKELEIQILKSQQREIALENAFLRSQLNSHLMYNSLSSIYNKALPLNEGLAESVLLLADTMEYALANPNENDKVSLTEEVAQMERFIKQNQILHNNSLLISFKKGIGTIAKELYLPPLLFINYIENVFKYGDLSDATDPAYIELSYDGKELRFSAYNKSLVRSNTVGKGIGLTNANDRIQRYYGSGSKMLISKSNTHFKVEITITL